MTAGPWMSVYLVTDGRPCAPRGAQRPLPAFPGEQQPVIKTCCLQLRMSSCCGGSVPETRRRPVPSRPGGRLTDGPLVSLWMCGLGAQQRAASLWWRSERGCDSPVPSLCRCLCSRPRPRQRCTSAPRTAPPETRSGRRSRSSSRSCRPCSCSWLSPSSTGTWAGTDRSSCCCTSCSSVPSSGQCWCFSLREEHPQVWWTRTAFHSMSGLRCCCRVYCAHACCFCPLWPVVWLAACMRLLWCMSVSFRSEVKGWSIRPVHRYVPHAHSCSCRQSAHPQ